MNATGRDGRGRLIPVVLVAVSLAACSTADTPAPSTSSTPAAATSSSDGTTTSSVATTTTASAPGVAARSIPVGPDGVTYDLEGSPPSGPSSFTITDEGAVVVADAHAVRRGEPRLLSYGPGDDAPMVIDLAPFGVAAVVDVVWVDGSLVVLDVDVARGTYRVLTLVGGVVADEVALPPGSRFPDGLTGLAVDDEGWLLEFELGARYQRVMSSGEVTPVETLRLGGVEVGVRPAGFGDEVVVGSSSFVAERATELGSTFVAGRSPDGSVVVMVDAVEFDEGELFVERTLRRYTASGDLVAEVSVPVGPAVDLPRPVELAPDGTVVYLVATGSTLELTTPDV